MINLDYRQLIKIITLAANCRLPGKRKNEIIENINKIIDTIFEDEERTEKEWMI